MANIKYKAYMLFQCLSRTIKDWRIACKGQKAEFELLQTAHRLEKGLTIETPRPLWGWEKAERIAKLNQIVDDAFCKKTGDSVLRAYLNSKRNSPYQEDRDRCLLFEKTYSLSQERSEEGGITMYKWNAFSNEEIAIIEQLFNTRHSIRTFRDDEISEIALRKAIDLALRCPSACNRQPFHIYVVDKAVKDRIGNSEGYNGDKYLFITSDVRAFTIGEFNDWIVSPSIFAGYLTLSLHLYGIGSCVIRKDLVCDTQFNNAVRAECNIPKDEKLILELAIGYYKSENNVPYSNRHKSTEIISFVK